jgi:hypothetical protein
VTDADTGRPVAGARVTSLKLAGTDFYRPNDHLSGRTDGAGRVRLEGLPVGRENLLLVLAPDGQPYLPAGLTADTTKGGDPVALGVRIRRGVWVEGRVTDAKSGRPLLAAVDVFYPEGNPNLARYPDLYVWGGMQRTDGTGHFRVPAVAGRAVVAVRLSGRDVPSRGQPAVAQAGRNYPLLKAVKLDGLSDKPLAIYRVVRPPRPLTSIDYHQIRSIEVPADKPTVECNFAIE